MKERVVALISRFSLQIRAMCIQEIGESLMRVSDRGATS